MSNNHKQVKEIATDNYPQLEPIISPWITRTISQKDELKKYIDKFGSPVNINNPKILEKNITLFQVVLKKHKIKHKIFLARKPNKCMAYVREAKNLKIGVDTASTRELMDCLKIGYDPKDLILTAATKNEKLINLAVKNKVLVIVDNYDELELLNKTAKEQNVVQSFGLRISGFYFKGKKLYSRFGFDIEKAGEVFERINSKYQNIKFLGFHFHLDGYSPSQRAESIIQLIKKAQQLKLQGIETSFIDIGGGFTVKYLKSEKQWNIFKEKLKMAVMGKISPITFKNNGLGYFTFGNKLLGGDGFYPYYNTLYKDKFLDKILSYKTGKKTVADLLRNLDLELTLEPGRAAFDQCGITVARVAFRKKDQNNNWLVGLEMNMTQLLSSSADFLVDPKIIYLGKEYDIKNTSCYFVGSYCLERDVILKRKITVSKLPQIGDLVCFINTAGYMMHFFESESHLFGLAQNLIINDGQKDLSLTPDK